MQAERESGGRSTSLLTRDQASGQSGESIDQYVTELRTLAAACEWGELKDDLICSRIVSGIPSRTVHERLLRESELSLKRAVEICRVAESFPWVAGNGWRVAGNGWRVAGNGWRVVFVCLFYIFIFLLLLRNTEECII